MLDTISLRDARAFPANFRGIKISLASPDKIKSWSNGEVTKAETINYRLSPTGSSASASSAP
jgi:DNA-directed RNA polymerase subunit beta'